MNLLFKLMLRPLMLAPAGLARERRLLLAFIEGGGLGQRRPEHRPSSGVDSEPHLEGRRLRDIQGSEAPWHQESSAPS